MGGFAVVGTPLDPPSPRVDVPLSQPKSRDLVYPLWDVGVPEIKTV